MYIDMTPEYQTKLFQEVLPNSDVLIADYKELGFPEVLTDEDLRLIHLLLLGRYGNNPISNLDENQFEIKLFSIIWQFGPTWARKVKIQERLRNLSEDELLIANKNIMNHAYNPSSEPSTGTVNEIEFIDDQSTTHMKRGVLEGYGLLMTLLEDDVTESFLRRFTKCFKAFVLPEKPLLYESED